MEMQKKGERSENKSHHAEVVTQRVGEGTNVRREWGLSRYRTARVGVFLVGLIDGGDVGEGEN